MSLSSALSIALGGMQTTTTLMQITANNISNAQTPGYTKKSATVSSTALADGTGGVQIASYNRATNNVLQQSYNAATANSSYLGTQYQYMQQVQTILNSTASNPALSDAVAKFQAAWTQLQTSPEDPTIQSAVVQAGNTLATQVGSVAVQVSNLRTTVNQDISATVSQLNTDLQAVYTLNQQIFNATANNQPLGNLQDQRDQLVSQLSSITNVSVFPRGQNQIAIYTPDGVALLDGVPDTFTNTVGVITTASGQDVTANLAGGSLQAEIQFNATATTPSSLPGVNTIQKLQGQLSAIVNAFTNSSAGPPETFAHAYNPAGTVGADFFTATSGDPTTFAVNTALITTPSGIPEANVAAVTATFSNNYNFTSTSAGLSAPSATYTGLVTTVISGFQQAANTLSSQSQTATAQASYYQQSLSNATGVNVDDELVNLTTLQNSYAASAHVISTIAQLFNDLMATI